MTARDRAADDRAVLDLCARLAREPERLIAPMRNPVGDGIAIAAHRHRDLLQLDLAIGCAGRWIVDGAVVPADGRCTALAFAPGVEHAYAVGAGVRGAEILNCKLRVEPRWPAIARRVLAPVAHGVAGEPLAQALRRAARIGAGGARTPAVVAAIIEALCLWPRAGGDAAGRVVDDARIEAAMARIEAQLARPPRLAELARRAGVTPRHLARRFRAVAGCTPAAWADARRLERARELLAQGRLTATAIAEAVGFASVHAFSRWFRRRAGRAPSSWRAAPDRF